MSTNRPNTLISYFTAYLTHYSYNSKPMSDCQIRLNFLNQHEKIRLLTIKETREEKKCTQKKNNNILEFAKDLVCFFDSWSVQDPAFYSPLFPPGQCNMKCKVISLPRNILHVTLLHCHEFSSKFRLFVLALKRNIDSIRQFSSIIFC